MVATLNAPQQTTPGGWTVDAVMEPETESTFSILVGTMIVVVTRDTETVNIHVWPDDARYEGEAVALQYIDYATRVVMVEPYHCERCGTVYDEAGGDGYCGLCPTCADETN